jgi:TonB family protein
MAFLQRHYLALFLLAVPLLAGAQDNSPSSPAQSPAASSSSSSEAAASAGDSTRLEILKSQKADYPLEAVEKEMQGEVWLKLHISETGDVESTDLISGEPILAEAAIHAAQKWKFKPFIRNGRPVKVSTQLPFDFAFKDNIKVLASAEVAKSTAVSPVPEGSGSLGAGTPSKKVRVDQGAMEGSVIYRVEPVYPLAAKRIHLQGEVVLQATIGKDGRIHDLTLKSGDPVLAQSAIGAVQQWRYRPYRLNGDPVEVETTVKIQFRM